MRLFTYKLRTAGSATDPASWREIKYAAAGFVPEVPNRLAVPYDSRMHLVVVTIQVHLSRTLSTLEHRMAEDTVTPPVGSAEER